MHACISVYIQLYVCIWLQAGFTLIIGMYACIISIMYMCIDCKWDSRMYACMYACMYVCTYSVMYMYVFGCKRDLPPIKGMHVFMYVCMHVCMNSFIYIYILGAI